MSRILRRPMFRGGRVNSDGVGITSGLDRAGYQAGPGPKPVSGSDILNQAMGKSGTLIGDTNRLLGNVRQGLFNYVSRPLGNIPIAASNYAFGTNFDYIQPMNYQQDLINLMQGSTDKTTSSMSSSANASEPPKTLSDEEMNKIFESEEFKEQEQEAIESQSANIPEVLKAAAKEDGNGDNDGDTITLDDDKTKAERLKAEFEQLLGIEKARGQDISDMLIRFGAAPGDDLNEKIRNYLALESKAGPSRTERIKSTAGQFTVKDILDTRKLDKQLEAYKAKLSRTGQTDMTRALAILDDPRSSEAQKLAALNKIGLEPTLNATLADLKNNKMAKLTPSGVESLIKVYKGSSYKGRLVSGAKNGIYFSPANKTLYTFDKNGNQVSAEVLNY